MDLNDKILALNANPQLEARGIRDINIPNPISHSRIISAVKEVAERMGINIATVIHNGKIECNSFSHKDDLLILSERIQSILTDDELKALIAHELDHKTKDKDYRDKVQRIDRVKHAPDSNKKEKVMGKLFAQLKAFRGYMEQAADDRAAIMYGAESMENALIKLIAHSDNTLYKMQIMDKNTADEVANVTPEQIIERLHTILATGMDIPRSYSDDLESRLHYLHTKSHPEPTFRK